MSEPSIDPEDLFWRQIEEQPGNPLPRLVYADWCDENDRPVMAIVQRWLAATGRSPHLWKDGRWFWLSDRARLTETVARSQTIPDALATRLREDAPGRILTGDPAYAVYDTQRRAEEALALAWAEATRPGLLRRAWRPELVTPAGYLTPVQPERTVAWPNLTLRERVIGVGILFGLCIGFGSCYYMAQNQSRENRVKEQQAFDKKIDPAELTPEQKVMHDILRGRREIGGDLGKQLHENWKADEPNRD